MSLFQQLLVLSIPVVLIWPLTAALVRLSSRSGHNVSPQSNCFRAGMLAFAVCIGTLLYFLAHNGRLDVAEALGGVAFFATYCFCVTFLNWFIFTVTETSMHTHLMVEVGREDGIPLAELERRYNKQAIIRARVPRLLQLGQLKLIDERLVLGGRWVLAGAEACRLLRVLLSIPPQPVQEDDATWNTR